MADVNKNNKGTRGIDISRVRESTVGLTDSAAMISRTADDVATGAESQVQALDSAVSVVNEMTASLKETAGLARAESKGCTRCRKRCWKSARFNAPTAPPV